MKSSVRKHGQYLEQCGTKSSVYMYNILLNILTLCAIAPKELTWLGHELENQSGNRCQRIVSGHNSQSMARSMETARSEFDLTTPRRTTRRSRVLKQGISRLVSMRILVISDFILGVISWFHRWFQVISEAYVQDFNRVGPLKRTTNFLSIVLL